MIGLHSLGCSRSAARFYQPVGMLVSLLGVQVCLGPLPASAAGRLYAVIAYDDQDENIGPYVKFDGLHVEGMLLGNVSRQVLADGAVTMISGAGIGAQRILSALRDLPSDAEDTVLFYYSGHGAYDDQQGHFFQFGGTDGQLTRAAVRRVLEEKRARLSVLITDCCYSRVPTPQVFAEMHFERPAATSPLFAALLFEVRGFVDITSSQQGEYSAVGERPIEGSLFTAALRTFLERNRQQRLSWKQVFDSVRTQAADRFRKQYPQGIEGQFTQTAWAFRLETAPLGGASVTTRTPATTEPPAGAWPLTPDTWIEVTRGPGTAVVRNGTLELALPAGAKGNAALWSRRTVRGNFDAQIRFQLQDWQPRGDVFHYLRFVAGEQPSDAGPAFLLIDRSAAGADDRVGTDVFQREQWSGQGRVSPTAARTGAWLIRRRQDHWDTWFWLPGQAGWTKLGEFELPLPAEVYLGASLGNDLLWDATSNLAPPPVRVTLSELRVTPR